MGFGSALKHNNAGVFRHPTQRKSCSSWPFMATAAFNSALSDNPMAPPEMREKTGPFMHTHPKWRNRHKSH